MSVVDPDITDVSEEDIAAQQPVSTGFGPVAAVNSEHEPVEEQPVVEAQPEQSVGQFIAANVERQAGTLVPQQIEPEQDSGAPPNAGAFVANAPSQLNRPATAEEMRKDLFKDIGKFGKSSGEGASALGRLGLRVLRGAADGLLSTAKVQGGKSDAVLIYEAYAAADSKHAEHTKGGMKANAAKLNAIIGMGCMTTCDPVAVGDRAVRLREKMEEADLKPKALFAGLVDVARKQQDSDVELSDAAIEEALTKTKVDKTLEKEWEAINKKIESIVTGENSAGLKDQSDRALKISELVAEHLKNFKSANADDELVVELVERGYTEAMAREIVRKRS
jgi:hypothetical protein